MSGKHKEKRRTFRERREVYSPAALNRLGLTASDRRLLNSITSVEDIREGAKALAKDPEEPRPKWMSTHCRMNRHRECKSLRCACTCRHF